MKFQHNDKLIFGWNPMPIMPGTHQARHDRLKRARDRLDEADRRKRHEYRKWYNTAAWRRIRVAHLATEPLCRRCKVNGVLNDGSRSMDGNRQTNRRRRHLVVNHIGGHGGDRQKFLTGPFETLCPDHHDIVAQAEEKGGDREPIDPKTGLPIEA